jgi:amino acid adenylation domain-containing protein
MMKGASPAFTPPGAEARVSPGHQPLGDGRGNKLVPLSYSQRQLWYLSHFDSGTIAYNQPVAWRLEGHLDVGALERSFQEVVRRHEGLRTRIPVVAGEPLQSVIPESALPLREIDLGALSGPARDARLQELLAAEAQHPFDLANEPLLRAVLLRTEDESQVLVITVHHTICDGWSMGILVKELVRCYNSFRSGTSPTLAEVHLQYPDFALWQRQQVLDGAWAGQIAYWRQRLQGAAVLDLPTDRARPRSQTFRGGTEYFTFPAALSASVKDLSADEGVFLFMTLLPAFQTLCSRYSGQTDILVGCPSACRRRWQTQGSIGTFVNLLALRGDLSGDPTVRQLLRQARDVVMGAYQNQDLPFDKLVEELQPTRDPSRNPLVQVVMDQVDARWLALDLGCLKTTRLPVDNGTSKFDLTFAWSDSSDGLTGWVEYNSDLFERPTIVRMLSHYQKLLEGFVSNPDQHISRLPLLTEPELRQVTVDWNGARADHPSDSCIYELFELQVERTPQAVAVECEGAELTFEELNHKSNQLARYLLARGVQPEALIGVGLERGLDLAVTLLGILKAGAAYVPLDLSYPRDRLAFMAEDAALKVMITQERFVEFLPASGLDVVSLDRDWERIHREDRENPGIVTAPDAAAYVIYTSGSTGQPKGVVGLHRGAVNRCAWMWKQYPFGAGETACVKTSLSFVDSVAEIFGPLLAGVRTVMFPEAVVKVPSRLIAALVAQRVTRIVLVPSLLQTLMEVVPNLDRQLPDLKYWVSSGETLSASLVERFKQSLPGRRLINLYGSSEVSADVTCYEVQEDKPVGNVPVGRPIANTQVYILDKHLQPVPVGVPGELCVGGVGLARGYLNRPEHTARAFIPDPFSGDPESRLYRTGDRGRFRPDGNIEMLGRLDRQVKIRGFRIELEEIESVLGRHAAVEGAAVAVDGYHRLAAYVVPRSMKEESPACQRSVAARGASTGRTGLCRESASPGLLTELRWYLKERLPDYMVPASFVLLNAFPLLPGGKIDRHALGKLSLGQEEPDIAADDFYTAPGDEVEQKIAGLWQDLLRVDRVSVHDNFFELGGHSLLGTQLIAMLQSEFGVQLPLHSLLEVPTVASMAERIKAVCPPET